MTDVLGELAAARRPWTSETIASWYTDGQLTAQLRSALAVEADRPGNASFGQELRDAVGIGGPLDPLAWANRRLELPDGGWAETGIRYRSLDVTRPFVDVIATTADPTPDGLAAVAAAVTPAYADLHPLCLRVDAPDAPALVEQLTADPRFGPRCVVDMHVVAAPVDTLRVHARATAYDSVTVRPGAPEPLALRVAEIYAELATQEPELARWARPEDLDSLTECADEGLLFEVLVDGAPAGVVAGLRYDAHAMAGFSVQELCLDRAHRGRRLAPAAVQRLLEELPADPGDVLWGTIHPANTPSLRNALSIGRALVGGFVFVTPAGSPGMP